MKHEEQLSAFVLAQIEWELENISAQRHRLARRQALLRERATLLRLGPTSTAITRQASIPGRFTSMN
jgi:hypothetical protein